MIKFIDAELKLESDSKSELESKSDTELMTQLDILFSMPCFNIDSGFLNDYLQTLNKSESQQLFC